LANLEQFTKVLSTQIISLNLDLEILPFDPVKQKLDLSDLSNSLSETVLPTAIAAVNVKVTEHLYTYSWYPLTTLDTANACTTLGPHVMTK